MIKMKFGMIEMKIEDFTHLMAMLRNELKHWTEVFDEQEFDREAEREIIFWEKQVKRFVRYE